MSHTITIKFDFIEWNRISKAAQKFDMSDIDYIRSAITEDIKYHGLEFDDDDDGTPEFDYAEHGCMNR